jgi:hypothetical protein
MIPEASVHSEGLIGRIHSYRRALPKRACVRSNRTMRRALAIFLAVAFGFGPCVAVLQSDADMRLPFCCRRHGAHHCAMSGDAAQSPTPQIAAPSRCPLYPGNLPATTTPLHALTASRVGAGVLLSEQRALIPFAPASRSRSPRTRDVRGPPVSHSS